MNKKYIYKNDGTVHEWTQELAEACEMENRTLPEDNRHVVFESDDPQAYKWESGEAVAKTKDEKIAEKLIPLDELKAEKVTEVNGLCEAKILQGFWSNATGINRHYQADRDDQTNIVGSVTANVDMPYKCGVSTTLDNRQVVVYDFVYHTAAQLKQVFLDGANIKSALLQNAYSLKNSISDATTQDELLAININDGWVQ